MDASDPFLDVHIPPLSEANETSSAARHLDHYKNFVRKAYKVSIPADCVDKVTIDNLVVEAVSTRINSKSLTPEDLKKRIYLVKNWEHGADGLNVNTFRQKYRIGYRLIRAQHRVSATSDGKEHLLNAKNQMYVHILQVFDRIAECHNNANTGGYCLRTAATKNAVDLKYANISREEVQAFVETCQCRSKDKVANRTTRLARTAKKSELANRSKSCPTMPIVDSKSKPQMDAPAPGDDEDTDDKRRKQLLEVREHLALLREFDGVIPDEEIAQRKRDLFLALPPTPPAFFTSKKPKMTE
jgi:hypothetical protein